jgi:hypothetical protein
MLILKPELLSKLEFYQAAGGEYFVRGSHEQNYRLATKEEVVRQVVVQLLRQQEKFENSQIDLEYPVQMGVMRKSADIVVMGRNGGIELLVEVKVKRNERAIEQLASYMHATGCDYGLLADVNNIVAYERLIAGAINQVPLDSVLTGTLSSSENAMTCAPHKGVELAKRLGIESVCRIDKNWVTIHINGKCLNFENKNFVRYQGFCDKALEKGVVIMEGISQSDWKHLVGHLFEEAEGNKVTPAIVSQDDTDSDSENIIREIFSRTVSVDGEKIELFELYQRYRRDIISGNVLKGVFSRYGMLLEGEYVVISNTHPTLKATLGRKYGKWGAILKKLPGTISPRNQKSFSGLQTRAVMIPNSIVLKVLEGSSIQE